MNAAGPTAQTGNATPPNSTGKTVALNITTGGTVTFEAAAGDSVRRFELNAYGGGLVQLPQYEIPVVFDLASMTSQENLDQLPLLRDHDFQRPVGHSADVAISETGVVGTGEMSMPGRDRDDIVEAADDGFEWQLSVGGTAAENDIVFFGEGETFTANNRGCEGPALFVKNYLLREISFVATGADNDGAYATLVAAFDSRTKGGTMTFEEWLKSQGIEIANLTADGLARQRRLFEAESNAGDDDAADDSGGGDDVTSDDAADESADDAAAIADSAGTTAANEAVAESMAETAANVAADEQERVGELETLNASFRNNDGDALTIETGGRTVSLLAHATRQRWTPERFELEARRRQRPQRMNPGRNSGGEGNNRVAMLAAMTFAIMGHTGANVERDFRRDPAAREYLNASLLGQDPNAAARDQAMNAAHGLRSLSLVDMVDEAMRLDGIDAGARRSSSWLQAAFSSNAVQTLFTTSTQAILLDTYMQSMSTYDAFAAIVQDRDVPNFLTNERKTASPDSGELEKLNPTGTAGDASLSATGETYQISRFAKRWGIDDQDMINESFGVFEDMPRTLGLAAARLYGQVVAKLLLSNPNMADGSAFFNTTDGNRVTSSALTAANVKASLTTFGTQTDGNVSLELDPNVLFVPKALRFTAAEIFADAPMITGNTTPTTSRNVLADTIDQVLHSALLDNGFNDPDDRATAIAGDATSWFLFDTRYPAIEVGHLQNGPRGPEIRSGQYDNGQYGMWFDVKRDLGAAPLRRASAQKNEA